MNKQQKEYQEETMILFAVRYAVVRFTGGPLAVVNYLLNRKEGISDRLKRDIIDEIDLWERVGTKMTDDWHRLRVAWQDVCLHCDRFFTGIDTNYCDDCARDKHQLS